MPAGIPVATVAINGAKNAGILAASILAVGNSKLMEKLTEYKENLNKTIEEKAVKLEKIGHVAYLNDMEQ